MASTKSLGAEQEVDHPPGDQNEVQPIGDVLPRGFAPTMAL